MLKLVEKARECADQKVVQEVITSDTVKKLVENLLCVCCSVVCQGGERNGLDRTKFDSLVSVVVEKDFLSLAGHCQR